MDKLVTIVELSLFLAQVGKTITPSIGDVIPGTGGLRKLRWTGKQQGKRGGLRVIYYFYNDTAPVFLLTVYSKNTQTNLTTQQKKTLTTLAKTLKATYKQKRGI